MNIPLHTQRGISLISLMVAMAIGIFLVGGVIKIYVDSKSSFNARAVVSAVAEDKRFAMDDIRRIVVMAGRGIRLVDELQADRRPFPAVNAAGIVDGGPTGSDTIAIRYRRGPSCGAYQDVSFSATPSTVRIYVDGANNLICELNTVNRVLASNATHLKAKYGVDTDNDGYADSYKTPTEVEALATPAGSQTPWSRVVSIRISLVVGSDSKLDTAPLYKTANTTLTLRNLNTAIQRQ